MEIPVTTLQAMLTNAATLGAMSAVKKLDGEEGHDQRIQERNQPELTFLLFESSD